MYYDTSMKGIIPEIVGQFVDKKSEYKTLSKKAAKAGDMKLAGQYTIKEKCTKVFANTLYGIMGQCGNQIYHTAMAVSVTSLARTANITLGKVMTNRSLPPSYADTDSQFS